MRNTKLLSQILYASLAPLVIDTQKIKIHLTHQSDETENVPERKFEAYILKADCMNCDVYQVILGP